MALTLHVVVFVNVYFVSSCGFMTVYVDVKDFVVVLGHWQVVDLGSTKMVCRSAMFFSWVL